MRAALLGPCGVRPATLLVAVSGGPDSLALLHALARVAPPASIALHVAYFDHGLRPAADVAAEREFVAEQAAALGLPFSWGAADVCGEARRQRRSIEDAARRCRYAYLGRLTTTIGAEAVATGHTATDQAETVLLRLLRGAGVAGLAAMAPRARWPLAGDGPDVVRPLLALPRGRTLAYCADLGLHPRHDPENVNPRYPRVRVRHELLPLLMELNPRAVEALGRVAIAARAVTPLRRWPASGGTRWRRRAATVACCWTARRWRGCRRPYPRRCCNGRWRG
ncbi:MAG: tRNA lysidine(34) synthetase TilS [Dehalococcoidia bacterium]